MECHVTRDYNAHDNFPRLFPPYAGRAGRHDHDGFHRCRRADKDNDSRAKRFIARHEATIRPLEIESSRCWWEANTTGSDEAFRKKEEIETRLDLLLANRETFAELKAIQAQPIRDPLVARQIAVLYLQYLGQQIDPELIKEMSARSNAVEKAYSVYRARVGGKELTENEVHDVLRTSKDSARRRAVWEASKAVGPILEPDLKKLARLRNRAARQLGFKDFHVMQLALAELEPGAGAQAVRRARRLDPRAVPCGQGRDRRGPGPAVRRERRRVAAVALPRPVLPGVAGHLRRLRVGLPADRHDQALSASSTTGIGLPIDDVLARSDLFEKPGKCPHAFCQDMDREGDVRVLANVVPGQEWLETMLHELGHAAYSEEHPAERSLRLADRVARLDHRRHGDDVRAAGRRCPLAAGDGRRACRTRRSSPPRRASWTATSC